MQPDFYGEMELAQMDILKMTELNQILKIYPLGSRILQSRVFYFFNSPFYSIEHEVICCFSLFACHAPAHIHCIISMVKNAILESRM